VVHARVQQHVDDKDSCAVQADGGARSLVGCARVRTQEATDCTLPLVVFGSSLAEQDMHLVEAINDAPDRPVAVSMR
jgi:hypothetical protein